MEKFEKFVTPTSIIEVFLLIFTIIVFSFVSTNIPELFEVGTKYFIWSIMSLAFLPTFIVLKPLILRFWSSSESRIKFFDFKIFNLEFKFWVIIINSLLTFFLFASTTFSIKAPRFQVIKLTPVGEAFFSAWAGISENFWFFMILPSIIFSVSLYFIRSSDLSLLISIISTPIIFLIYHTYVYGFDNLVASTFVYLFGLEQMIWMYLVGEALYIHARHGLNNFARVLFSEISFQTFITMILTSPITWILILLGGAIGVLKMKKRKVVG